MPRSPIDLPRMQNQPRARVPLARAPNLVPRPAGEASPRPRKPRMMRQYELIDRVKQYNPATNEDLLNRAYVYAMRAHGEQRRASGDPFFSHPLEVAAILTDLKLDDATIAAALLHDTIEDTDATRAEIDRVFGHDIGRLVEGLTKLKKLDLVSKEAKQAENLRKLLLAIADDVRVLLIKLADRLHNMRTLAHRPPEARRRTAEETLDIYAPLAARSARGAVERLDQRDRATADEKTRRPRHRRGRFRQAQARLLDLAQDGAQGSRLRAIVGYFRLPCRGRQPCRVLPGARDRAHVVAGSAGALQGLHLDAEAERLSLDPYHGDRAGQAAR